MTSKTLDAILENVKTQLLSDDAIRYITGQFKKALQEIEHQPDNSALLKDKLRLIDAKLAKLADAVEAVGVNHTLADRLTTLEQEMAETEIALKQVPAPVTFLADVFPALIQRWRELVISIESLADAQGATLKDIEAARPNLRALLGTVTLKPRDGILWAHPAPSAKGLVETRPLDGLRINSPFFGSGGSLRPLATAMEPIAVLEVPLIAAQLCALPPRMSAFANSGHSTTLVIDNVPGRIRPGADDFSPLPLVADRPYHSDSFI